MDSDLLPWLVQGTIRIHHILQGPGCHLSLVFLKQSILAEEDGGNTPAALLCIAPPTPILLSVWVSLFPFSAEKMGKPTSCCHTIKSQEKSSVTLTSKTPATCSPPQFGHRVKNHPADEGWGGRGKTETYCTAETESTLQVGLVHSPVHLIYRNHLDLGSCHGLTPFVAPVCTPHIGY